MIDFRLKRAIKGDINAYQEIIEEIKVYMYSIAISFFKDDNDASDAIGNTIIIAYEHLNELRKPEFFKTWLTRILINECKKIALKKDKVVSIEEYVDMIEEDEEDKEQKLDLKNYIDKLPNNQKSMVLLYYYEEMSIEEISKLLNVAEGTIKSRLFVARKNLKKIIERGGGIYK